MASSTWCTTARMSPTYFVRVSRRLSSIACIPLRNVLTNEGACRAPRGYFARALASWFFSAARFASSAAALARSADSRAALATASCFLLSSVAAAGRSAGGWLASPRAVVGSVADALARPPPELPVGTELAVIAAVVAAGVADVVVAVEMVAADVATAGVVAAGAVVTGAGAAAVVAAGAVSAGAVVPDAAVVRAGGVAAAVVAAAVVTAGLVAGGVVAAGVVTALVTTELATEAAFTPTRSAVPGSRPAGADVRA